VVYEKDLVEDHDALGMARYRTDVIALQPQTEGIQRQGSQIEQTYLHEVVHMILNHLSYSEARDDEMFVDLFSKALYQVLETSEGDINE